MRCFKEIYSCQKMLTIFKIHYNFLRPHQGLNGKTPAQAAGIHIDTSEGWVSLIRQALLSETAIASWIKKIKGLKKKKKALSGKLQKLKRKLKDKTKSKNKKKKGKKVTKGNQAATKRKKEKKQKKVTSSGKDKATPSINGNPGSSADYNVRDGLAKMQSLKNLEELYAFTKGEKRNYIVRAIPAKIRKLKKLLK